MTNKNILLVVLLLALVGVGYIVTRGNVKTPQSEEVVDEENDLVEEAVEIDSVSVYVVSLESGSLGCGDAVVPIQRNITPTLGVLGAALEELFSLPAEDFGPGEEFYNALESSDLQVESVNLSGGVATVYVTGTATVGGVCDEPRFVEQIKQTALQFPEVDEAEIYVNGTLLEDLFSQE